MTPVERLIAKILRQARDAESLAQLRRRESGPPNMGGQGLITTPGSPYGLPICERHDPIEDDSAW